MRTITKYSDYRKVAHKSRIDVLDAFQGEWVIFEKGTEQDEDHFSIRGNSVRQLWTDSDYLDDDYEEELEWVNSVAHLI